jgi:AcrR family transcriptional regulator
MKMAKGERTRKEILDHAFALTAEVGLEALSLGMLAASAGMSKSGLFAHFKSKEALQIGVINEALERLITIVVRPALAQPRGEPRVRALFERYLLWKSDHNPSGCIFVALSHEYDDRPGVVRDRLVETLRDWHVTIRRVAITAVEQGHFRKDLDPDLFSFEFHGIGMAHHHLSRLVEDPNALRLTRAAFEGLMQRSLSPSYVKLQGK